MMRIAIFIGLFLSVNSLWADLKVGEYSIYEATLFKNGVLVQSGRLKFIVEEKNTEEKFYVLRVIEEVNREVISNGVQNLAFDEYDLYAGMMNEIIRDCETKLDGIYKEIGIRSGKKILSCLLNTKEGDIDRETATGPVALFTVLEKFKIVRPGYTEIRQQILIDFGDDYYRRGLDGLSTTALPDPR